MRWCPWRGVVHKLDTGGDEDVSGRRWRVLACSTGHVRHALRVRRASHLNGHVQSSVPHGAGGAGTASATRAKPRKKRTIF